MINQMQVTKDNLPQIRAVLMEYEQRSREAFTLETEILRVTMAMVDKLEQTLSEGTPMGVSQLCKSCHAKLDKKQRLLPMGCSNWSAYGKKYGYWDYFKEKCLEELM